MKTLIALKKENVYIQGMEIKLYSGMDSQGTSVEIAVASHGAFIRYWRASRYGYSWSKWAPYSVQYVTTYEDKMGNVCSYSEPRVMLGFRNIPLTDADCKRVRLPKH